MADLNDLNLPEVDEGEEAAPDYDDLPPQFGAFSEPLQPDIYRFKLPARGPSFEAIVDNASKPRIRAAFQDDRQLRIVGSKERYRLRIDNIPRNKGADQPMVSNMDYLLAKTGEVPKSKSRKHYGDALLRACAREAEFIGITDLSAWCSETQDIRNEDGERVPGKKGCGRRYSSRPYKPEKPREKQLWGGERFAIPKVAGDSGKFEPRFLCKCGALLYAFSNIVVYREAD